jgi:hypothetical protein
VKYLLTLSFSWFFVTILDYFLWGKGTITEVIFAAVICLVDVKMIFDILKEEEIENA